MNFLIVTHVNHKKQDDLYYGYAPYVREMNLWFKYVDKVLVVGSISEEKINSIDFPYTHKNIKFSRIPTFSLTSFTEVLKTIFKLPIICIKIFSAMRCTDHIHLRCPGNIGLLGCILQVFFPKKPKTAKYAGNWDPNAKQPLSYRFQKWILSNTFLTKNMKVLVYGEWHNQTKNIIPFFTATYSENEIKEIDNHTKFNTVPHELERTAQKKSQIKFLFVGTLSAGKQPLLTVKVVQQLLKMGYDTHLDIYGEGQEHSTISHYLKAHQLEERIILHGNVPKEMIKKAYKTADFLLFISKSEGWPKVVAEAMFWGCLPISSNVSCIPYMLNYGKRGAIVKPEIEKIVSVIESYLLDEKKYDEQVKRAMEWSRQFTIEKFDNEISKLVKQ